MTHRKMIILSLLAIAGMANVVLALAILRMPDAKEIIMAIIAIITNVASGMAGFYIGKSREQESYQREVTHEKGQQSAE